MDQLLQKLTDYVLALSKGSETVQDANARPMLTRHLAVAAEMYALLHKHQDVSAIAELVKSENRSHGWSFIPGATGDDIATAWAAFKDVSGVE